MVVSNYLQIDEHAQLLQVAGDPSGSVVCTEQPCKLSKWCLWFNACFIYTNILYVISSSNAFQNAIQLSQRVLSLWKIAVTMMLWRKDSEGHLWQQHNQLIPLDRLQWPSYKHICISRKNAPGQCHKVIGRQISTVQKDKMLCFWVMSDYQHFITLRHNQFWF